MLNTIKTTTNWKFVSTFKIRLRNAITVYDKSFMDHGKYKRSIYFRKSDIDVLTWHLPEDDFQRIKKKN